MAWRTHYLQLLAEGEAANLRGAALGDYIQTRLTPQELREALREHMSNRAQLISQERRTEPPEGTL